MTTTHKVASERVVLLHHVRKYGDDREDVKLIGVYSSRQTAQQAIARLQGLPGFRDNPELFDPGETDEIESGFNIDEYEVDVDHWSEGFGID